VRHSLSKLLLMNALWSLATGFTLADPGSHVLPLAGKIIVLDPGHATKNDAGIIINPGAQARHRNGGAYERDVALAVGTRMVPILEAEGAKVFMTRTPRNPWRYNELRLGDNRARAIFANLLHANAYVRLHCDWNKDRKFKGHTTYYFQWASRTLAADVNDSLTKTMTDQRDNGVHRRSFVSVTSRLPTALVEMGVLSYKPEAKALADPAYQEKLAQAIAEGITTYLVNH
jgi:N-acetylmuramoyl-L-alanine amidase